MTRNLDRLKNGAFVIVLLGAVVFTVLVAFPGVIGAKASFVVLSDSMTPTFQSGDMVVVRSVEPTAVSDGSVITYWSPNESSTRVTHRVIDVERSDGTVSFRTKGDANDIPDPYRVRAADLIGEVWFVVPFVGYFVRFASTGAGTIVLIVFPGTLLFGTELWNLWNDRRGAG
jgi:signal peptidase